MILSIIAIFLSIGTAIISIILVTGNAPISLDNDNFEDVKKLKKRINILEELLGYTQNTRCILPHDITPINKPFELYEMDGGSFNYKSMEPRIHYECHNLSRLSKLLKVLDIEVIPEHTEEIEENFKLNSKRRK